jgi:hypothetical protein
MGSGTAKHSNECPSPVEPVSRRSCVLLNLKRATHGPAHRCDHNLEGAVAGWYIDRNNVCHGFVWTP